MPNGPRRIRASVAELDRRFLHRDNEAYLAAVGDGAFEALQQLAKKRSGAGPSGVCAQVLLEVIVYDVRHAHTSSPAGGKPTCARCSRVHSPGNHQYGSINSPQFPKDRLRQLRRKLQPVLRQEKAKDSAPFCCHLTPGLEASGA